MIALNHILVATDFSEPAEMALAYGRELARRFGATLHVLHVVQDLGLAFATTPIQSVDLGQLQVETEAAAQTHLQTLLSDRDRTALNAKAVVLTSPSPWNAIVGYARDAEPPIDCIVLGTAGRGAFSRMLMGSVAERVVRSAPCPVLTIRHPEHEFVLPDQMTLVARA